MQTKVILWLFVPLLALDAGVSQAKERRQTPTRNEKVARAQWQPVRQASQVESVRPGRVVELDSHPSDGEVYLDPLPMHGGPACDAIGPDGACDSFGCDTCGPRVPDWRPCLTLCLPRDGWASFEYLLWFQNGMNLPPLVSRDIAADSEVLFGGDQVLEDSLHGGRLQVGVWLDACHEWAVQGEYFSTGTTSTGFSLTSNGNPSVGRPYRDVDGMVERSFLIGSQDGNGNVLDNGNIGIDVRSQLQGAGVNILRKLCGSEGCGDSLFRCLPQNYKSQFAGLIGYRWLELEEDIAIDSTTRTTRTDPDAAFRVRDFFETRSQFNGLDIGALYTRQRGCWSLDMQTKLALGTSRQTVSIQGITNINEGADLEGGLLGLPSNSGIFKRDRFAVVPELNAKLGYQLTPRLKATVGYTFIYWSNVVRPGDQISRTVDDGQVPALSTPVAAASFPEFAFNEIDYWVQGISFGGDYRW
ncbi:MAG: BBP7 family outer membrane beta-barrel protein [Pirellulaceae bacterium]